MEAAGSRLLIDPGGFSVDEAFELQDLDGIVITHQHPDHVDTARLPGLLELNPDAVLIADPETAGTLETGSWTSNADGLETTVRGLTVRGVGSQHAVILEALPRVANIGVLVSADGEPTLFHPGDTYEHAPADVDVLALPLAAPWAKVSETVEFVQRVSPTSLFPIHDGTIAKPAYGIYWQHVGNHGGVDDLRRLDQTETATFDA